MLLFGELLSRMLRPCTITGRYTVQIAASEKAPAAWKLIQLFIDGASVATTANSSLSYSWNTTNVLKGTHTLKAQATDTLNNSSIGEPE